MKRSIIFWSSYPITSKFYKPRWGHSLNLYKNKAYIFGGYTNKYKRDLYSIDLSSTKLKSEKIKPNNIYPQNFNNRVSQHSTIIYNNMLIIYGGKTSNSLEISINPISFNFNTNKWDIIKTINPPKLIRAAHTANLINNKYMFIFGGEESYNKNNNHVFDAILLDLEKLQWNKLNYPNSQKLNKRKYHCSCNINKSIVYIYGGYYDDYNCINSMLIFNFYNINNIIVKEINFDNYTSIIYPFPRWGCSISFYLGKLYIFGGRNKIDFNDLWMFDIKNEKWELLDCFNNYPIPRRRQISFIYKNVLFISGGFNGYQFLNDLYYTNLNMLYPFISYIINPISNININKDMNVILNTLIKSFPGFKKLLTKELSEKEYINKINSIPFFKFKNNSDLIPLEIYTIFINFIQNKQIKTEKSVNLDMLCSFIEGLFYADFYSFDSLYNQIERIIIHTITINSYSKKFIFFILICSYYTNSKILFHYILIFMRNKFQISVKKICTFIKKFLEDDPEKHDLLNKIIHNWNFNTYYYKLNKNVSKIQLNTSNPVVSDFSLFEKDCKFIEENNVKAIINRLHNAKIKFLIPKLQ